jgi:hypothetical protein
MPFTYFVLLQTRVLGLFYIGEQIMNSSKIVLNITLEGSAAREAPNKILESPDKGSLNLTSDPKEEASRVR